MKLRARFGTREDVRHESADNRTNDPEPDRPHERQVHVHERFCSPPGDQTNDDVPNQMKHDVSSFEFRIGGYQADRPETMRISEALTTKDTNHAALRQSTFREHSGCTSGSV